MYFSDPYSLSSTDSVCDCVCVSVTPTAYSLSSTDSVCVTVCMTVCFSDHVAPLTAELERLRAQLSALEHETSRYRCGVCGHTYRQPLVSTHCWHVHCTPCWHAALVSRPGRRVGRRGRASGHRTD